MVDFIFICFIILIDKHINYVNLYGRLQKYILILTKLVYIAIYKACISVRPDVDHINRQEEPDMENQAQGAHAKQSDPLHMSDRACRRRHRPAPVLAGREPDAKKIGRAGRRGDRIVY